MILRKLQLPLPNEALPYKAEQSQRVLSIGQALLCEYTRADQLPQTQQRWPVLAPQDHAV